MIIKDKLKNLVGIIKEHKFLNTHKVTSIAALGLVGLIGITSLKDNVHFGAVNLHNPQENHYAWGIWPTIGIEGEKDENINGNFYSIGLLAGVNNVRVNSTITGDMKAYGLLFGKNNVEPNSIITGNMKAGGLLAGVNNIEINLTITGNMKSYSLLFARNFAKENLTITGNIYSRGLCSMTPMSIRLGSNVEIGLKNYVVKEEDNKKQDKE